MVSGFPIAAIANRTFADVILGGALPIQASNGITNLRA